MATLFKTASRFKDLAALTAAKAELDDIFSVVKGANGKVNIKGRDKLAADHAVIAQLVTEIINDTYILTDPLPFLFDVVDGDIRDQYTFQEQDSTLRVIGRAYGTKPISQRVTFREYSMTTTMREVAVEIPLEELASGRMTASQYTDNMAAALQREKISQGLSAIDAAVTAIADRTGLSGYNLRYAGLTQGNLDKALDGIWDESENPIIFARHSAIYPALRAFTGWSQDTLRELEQRGVVGQYRGASISVLKDQYSKIDATHLIPNDRLWIASSSKGARLMNKDVAFLNWSMVDPRSSTFGAGVRVEYGFMVYDPYEYRIVTV